MRTRSETMNNRFPSIHEELMEYKKNPDRLKKFNTEFIQLLKKYRPKADYFRPLFKWIDAIDEGGNPVRIEVLNYTKLIKWMDRTGKNSDLYIPDEHRFKMIPSKEFLLLVVVALELNDHVDEILATAGYATYMKNLNEFIIFVGLKDKIGIDQIRDKLIDYGFRGDKAIDYEYNFSLEKSDSRSNFHKLLSEYCELKGLKIKNILKETGFYSKRWDASKNKYYHEAFTGVGDSPVRLTNEQVLRLFNALSLSKEEQIKLANQLIENMFLFEDEEEYLLEGIEDGLKDFLQLPTRNTGIDELKATNVSVRTTFIHENMQDVSWAALDGFIRQNIGNVRSFALFFEDVLEYERINIREFTLKTGLADSALYEYRNGLSIPEAYRLTVIASLLPRMNEYIYLTLLKKAGKFEFGEKSDSPLIMIMKSLVNGNEDNEILFGELFDVLEMIFIEEEEITKHFEELCKAYQYQCETLVRHLQGLLQDETLKSLLTIITTKKQDDTLILLSEGIASVSLECSRDALETICNILKSVYNFSDSSKLIKSILQHIDQQLEV